MTNNPTRNSPGERVDLRTSELAAANMLSTAEAAERRRVEEAQDEGGSRLILDTIPGLVAILTPAGEVAVVNHELVEYCGQPLEAMKPWGTNGSVHVDDLPRIGPVLPRRSRQAIPTTSRHAFGGSTASTVGVRSGGFPGASVRVRR